MKHILWNIEAMGWFERISHLLEFKKVFRWSGECMVRNNLAESIDALADAGYNITAVSSKNEDYALECLKFMKLENKLSFVSDLWESNMATDYSSAIRPEDEEIIVIGTRPGHIPTSNRMLFVHNHNAIRKDAKIDHLIIKKLEEEGHGSPILGFSRMFFDNFTNNPDFIKDDIIINGIDFYGLSLNIELRSQGGYLVSTVMVEDNAGEKQRCYSPR